MRIVLRYNKIAVTQKNLQAMNLINSIQKIISHIRCKHSCFTLLIRLLSVCFTGLYITFFFEVHFDWYAYSLQQFIYAFFVYLIYGIIGNFGLFFITTKISKKIKLWATFFYIPTLFITPIVVGAFTPYYSSMIILFLCAIFVYYYFNPWRKI